MSLGPALFVWVWPQGMAWLWVVLAGILGTSGHMLWTRALKLGEVTALMPISFMQLPMVAIAGYLWFGESLDRWTVLGAAIIVGSNLYITHREAALAARDELRREREEQLPLV
jgi:drug/metabolite transporter (DMT)-like permease